MAHIETQIRPPNLQSNELLKFDQSSPNSGTTSGAKSLNSLSGHNSDQDNLVDKTNINYNDTVKLEPINKSHNHSNNNNNLDSTLTSNLTNDINSYDSLPGSRVNSNSQTPIHGFTNQNNNNSLSRQSSSNSRSYNNNNLETTPVRPKKHSHLESNIRQPVSINKNLNNNHSSTPKRSRIDTYQGPGPGPSSQINNEIIPEPTQPEQEQPPTPKIDYKNEELPVTYDLDEVENGTTDSEILDIDGQSTVDENDPDIKQLKSELLKAQELGETGQTTGQSSSSKMTQSEILSRAIANGSSSSVSKNTDNSSSTSKKVSDQNADMMTILTNQLTAIANNMNNLAQNLLSPMASPSLAHLAAANNILGTPKNGNLLLQQAILGSPGSSGLRKVLLRFDFICTRWLRTYFGFQIKTSLPSQTHQLLQPNYPETYKTP